MSTMIYFVRMVVKYILSNELILVLQFYEEQKNTENIFGIKLIPDKSEVFTISSKDGFVSLAQDEG